MKREDARIGLLHGLSYEEFFTDDEIDTFRRVKLGQMRLAEIARSVIVEMVNGRIGNGKHFIETPVGRFRMALRWNSDNETERRDNDRLRAELVVMGDNEELAVFFRRHLLDESMALIEFHERVREAMRDY